MWRRLWLGGVVTATLLALGMTGPVALARTAGPAQGAPKHHQHYVRTGLAAGNKFCKALAKKRIAASAGAQMFCFGLQRTGPQAPRHFAAAIPPGNVNAASLSEDVSPNGVRGYGQSETSIAAAGKYVVEAWNDSTTFFAPCPSPMSKEEGTGFAFSANGGQSFTDLGGLPNNNCNSYRFQGDPSVAAYVVGGSTYFYISSLYNSTNGLGASEIAMDACKVEGSGSSATLSCSQPIIIGTSSQCMKIQIAPHKFALFCSFLDKEFLAVDPARGRLYATFSDFLIKSPGNPEVLSACDLGNPAGGAGPAGGTPAAPVCQNGARKAPAKPYLWIAPPDHNGCENEGAYPAVDPVTGAVYVGYEHNWATNLFGGPCGTVPTTDVLTMVPLSCLPLAVLSGCPGPTARLAVPVTSLVSEFVPGYNRFPLSDFPRLAVSDPSQTVSMVWNDGRVNPLGDILLQSFSLNGLQPVQQAPVVLDNPASGGVHFLPALRFATPDGKLAVSWYSRDSATTAVTNVDAAIGVDPRTTVSPASNVRITSAASDWNNASSDIVPNFGDYTDNAISVTGSPPYVGGTLYVAWSDGRLGIPQPFAASLPGG